MKANSYLLLDAENVDKITYFRNTFALPLLTRPILSWFHGVKSPYEYKTFNLQRVNTLLHDSDCLAYKRTKSRSLESSS